MHKTRLLRQNINIQHDNDTQTRCRKTHDKKNIKKPKKTIPNQHINALSLFKDIFIKLLKSNNKIKEALLENLITEMIEDLSSSLIDPPNTERIVNDITNKFPGNIKRA